MKKGKGEAADSKPDPGPLLLLKELVSSPLALALLSAFLTLAVIEGVFIALLSQDVIDADRTASHELILLRMTERVSQLMDEGQAIRKESKKAFATPEPDGWRDAYRSAYNTWLKKLRGQEQSYREAGIDPACMKPTFNSLSMMDELISNFLPGAERTSEEHAAYEQAWVQLLKANLRGLRDLHKLVSAGGGHRLVFDCSPTTLFAIGAAINLLCLIFIILLVERRITRPIALLVEDCGKISSAEVMKKPERVTDEIGSLQQSFYEMSVRTADNEKSRRNFLDILQSVQVSTIRSVRDSIAPIANLETLAPKAKTRCLSLVQTLEGLIQLLNWMTEALSTGGLEEIAPHYAACDTATLANSAVEAVESLVLDRKIAVKTATVSANLECDAQLIQRVLVNLLSNAIKYSRDGDEILIKCDRKKDTISFSIQDHGAGISPEDQGKLFKRFSQLQSPDGLRRRGHGLGLSICKQIVEAHGGRIGCDSEPGRGSVFWFELPLAATRSTAPQKDSRTDCTPAPFLKVRRRHSIKTGFALLLVAFVASQSLLAGMLCSGFDEASKRAAVYARKKELLFGVQEYLIMFLVWSYQMERIKDRLESDPRPFTAADSSTIMSLLAKMTERMALSERVIRMDSGSQAAALMEEVLSRDRSAAGKIRQGMRFAAGNPDELLRIGKEVYFDMDKNNDDVFKAITLGREDIEAAYERSAVLRSQILAALIAAGVLDILLLASITAGGLGIIHKVARLQEKAREFAGGAVLQETLKGNDELALLDARFCSISASVKDSEARRQNILSVISHDLATPLSSVLTGLSMLSKGLYQALPQKELAALKQSERDLKKLLQQTYDLLMIEKIDSGTLSPRKDSHEVLKILNAVTGKFAIKTKEKQLNIEQDVDVLAGVKIFADIQLTERLFEILLENSLDAAPAGTTIHISGSQADETITVYFENEGFAISEELQKQLFNRFRFINGKPLTGLGLPLASRLCKLASAEICVSSSSDSGTRAEINFPGV